MSYLVKNAFRPLCSIFSKSGHVFYWIINPNNHFVVNTLRNNHVKFTSYQSGSFSADFQKFGHEDNDDNGRQVMALGKLKSDQTNLVRFFIFQNIVVIKTEIYIYMYIYKTKLTHTTLWLNIHVSGMALFCNLLVLAMLCLV